MAKFQAEHPGAVSHEEAKAMREFVGRHGKALAVAFRKGKAAFPGRGRGPGGPGQGGQEAAQ